MDDSLSFSEMSEHSDSLGLHEKTVKFLARHVGLIVLVLFALSGVWVLDDYGVALDTGIQRDTAIKNLDYVLGRRDFIYPDYVGDRFYGVSFELPLVLLERGLGLEDTRDVHLMRHLVTHLFFLAGGFFCYLLAYRLFNNRLVALFAMLLFLLHPRIYAHSFFNSKDIPFLSMFMICLYLTHRAFGNGGIWRFLILGIAVGVLINLRIMGVTLFVMVAGMQVLDVLRAQNADARGRMLGSILLFVLSCAVTLYTVSPYLWSDPFGNSIEWFAVFSQHPSPVDHMFRGDIIVSTIVNPPEYVPVWMSITTPPVMLVLGVAGALVVLLRGLFSPNDILGDTRLRFGFMLIGCFMLPILAVIVLSSNVYHGWRQVYFLYAPFCILAMFGFHRLMSACIVFRLSRAFAFGGKGLMYGSIGIGFAIAVASMFSIHPHQHLYFNFLVDRTTPSYIRSEYELDYWLVTFREGYERLLERHPSGSLHVHLPHAPSVKLNWEILTESDRERLILQGGYFDFYITSYKDWLPSESASRDVTAPLVHSREVYGNKVLGVAAVDLSLVDDSVAARYRKMHRSTVSGKPVVSSEWDIYIDDGALVYIKEPCTVSDFNTPFFMHVTMDDINNLPGHRRSDGHSTRNLDFEFGRFGIRFDGRCMAVVPLPDDGLSGIRTGQFASDGELWGIEINVRSGGESAYRAEYESVFRDDPVVSSEFDAYLSDSRLIYIRDPCDASDTDAEFFLDVTPSDVGDLSPPRRESGFDNLDFMFKTRGLMFDGMCVASIGLPDYDIKRIATGQHGDEGRAVWSASYNVSAADELTELAEKLQGGGVEHVISSDFDVYLDGERLTYFRSDCAAEDVDAPFFVHLYPTDVDDLPPGRMSSGFDSFSFGLLDQGVIVGEGCFTGFDLPDYDVAGFLTGQFIRDEGSLWEDGHSFIADELQGVVEELRGRGTEPVIRSLFDVYLDDDRLTYVRDSCTVSDADAKFFLHVVPSDISNLSQSRRGLGFDNLDFVFETHGLMFDGMCIASMGLPGYGIKRIRTGQWDPEQQRNLWKEEFHIDGD